MVRRITGELAGLAEKAATEAEQLLVDARRALHRALRRAQVKAVEQFAGWDAGIACAGQCAGAAPCGVLRPRTCSGRRV